MTTLNHCLKPLEPRHVNVEICTKCRKDIYQFQAYSCTHFPNTPHAELRKRTGGKLQRPSTVCMFEFGFDMKTRLPSEWFCACVSRFAHSLPCVPCVLSPLFAQMQLHFTNRCSGEKTLIGRMNIIISLLSCPLWLSFQNSIHLCLTFPVISMQDN
jgi:hypothetical protein